MSLSIQLYTMVSMVAMGLWLGMAVDTYGRFFHPSKNKHIILYLNDILFWLLQGLLVFYVLFSVNEGELRLYVFLALLCGYAAYRALIEKIFRSFLEMIIQGVVGTYRFFRKIVIVLIINPIKGILKLLLALGMMVVSTISAIFFFLLKLILTPIKWLGRGLWHLVPKQVKRFFYRIAGFLTKAQNLFKKWMRKFKKW
ncbi:spore cortex biosynthesis protein YabQ [Pseudalkalibacillus caeni]|uniref:Spore cortex biosynthesis protein YabQ n=1 Tax=Exobacillus caeni TaxID=2574798 RepID=A0A5R9EUV2_9BACL|nr:spore cortex biosynthesis protein YabQ [Pseudalkalibacillus caeni]TLS34982.1 spore cortex biosynthesis protein YabQ [Pseudalkalibacillus caeni]